MANPKPYKKRVKKSTIENKICSNCGAENTYSSTECHSCDKKRFEPSWVKALRPINRQFGVQITSTSPEYGDVVDRITLHKWWVGGSSTFHFPNPEQWHKVVRIIEQDLFPKLGWKPLNDLVDSAVNDSKSKIAEKLNLAKLAKDYPSFIKELIGAIDPDKFSKSDFSSIVETFNEIADVLSSANVGFRETFLSVIRKLPKQKKRALEDLDLLLKGWSLQVITNVAQQVKSRLDTIEIFEAQIGDHRTFEIIGDNSIHRILERAMWLVDERYWILHSNKSLRVSIGKEMSRRDKKKFGSKRPDFVCGTIGDKLIILELKRPSQTLKVEDLNQLETYLTISEKYFNFNTSRGYLVGSKISEDLRRALKYRKGMEIIPYSNLIDDSKKRYTEFLRSLDDQ